jgi:hypothetical protein
LGQTAAGASTSKGLVPSSSGRQFIQMAREDLSHRVFSPSRLPFILLLAYWLLIQSPTTSTSLGIHLA